VSRFAAVLILASVDRSHHPHGLLFKVTTARHHPTESDRGFLRSANVLNGKLRLLDHLKLYAHDWQPQREVLVTGQLLQYETHVPNMSRCRWYARHDVPVRIELPACVDSFPSC
jgi:hypothetical protein